MAYRLSPILVALVACASGPKKPPATPADDAPKLDITGPWSDPETDYPQPVAAPTARLEDALHNPAARPIVIRGATILTASGKRIENGTVVLDGGAITEVADGAVDTPAGATVIDGTGKFVTPGIIDAHSHVGVYAQPGVSASADGNEWTSPNTAQVAAEYGYWPQDPAITRAVAGGVTAALILPGSANLIGGRAFTVVMRTGQDADDVRFPGAPPALKMACGENPKRTYGDKGGPKTRMGEYAAFREAFQQAAEYEAKRKAYARARALWLQKKARAAELDAEAERAGKKGRVAVEAAPEPPARDAKLETLAAVLRGEVLVEIHCYRSDELRQMVAIADQFGFHIRAFHHALEAYKERDLLAAKGIAVATWADWWGFKMEAFDGIPENAALIQQAGGRPVIKSDSAITMQRLNQEAAKAMYSGRAAGIPVTEDQALRWVTANPAWVLGIDSVVGTVDKGKRADLVLWSAHPFSVYARPDVVIEAGEVVYRRSVGLVPTDFELGNSALDDQGGAR